MLNPWNFDGPEVCNCKGSKISWNKGKNATLRPVRKIKDGQIVTKWAKRNSFFNFFTPPKLTRYYFVRIENLLSFERHTELLYFRDALMDPENRTLFEAHFQIGLYLKETFIPQAIKFYLNYSKFHKTGYSSTHDSVAKSKTKPAAVTPTKNLVKSTIPTTSK